MKTPIYVSYGSFEAPSFATICDLCVKHGIYGVELGSSCSVSASDLSPLSVPALTLPKLLIHNYFPHPDTPFILNLAANSAAIRTLSINHCLRAIDLCVELKLPFYSFHSGFAFEANPEQLGGSLLDAPRFSKDKAHKCFIESLKYLCEYAEKNNLPLLIENNVVTTQNLVNGRNDLLLGATADELLQMLNEVNSPLLGLLVDMGHLKVTAKSLGFDRETFLTSLCKNVKAYHFSDNDGVADEHLEFDEKAWFLPYLAGLTEAVMILETRKTQIAKIYSMIEIVDGAILGKTNEYSAN